MKFGSILCSALYEHSSRLEGSSLVAQSVARPVKSWALQCLDNTRSQLLTGRSCTVTLQLYPLELISVHLEQICPNSIRMHSLHCIAYISSCMAMLVERHMFSFIHVARYDNSQFLGFDAFGDVWDPPTIWLTEEVVVRLWGTCASLISAEAQLMQQSCELLVSSGQWLQQDYTHTLKLCQRQIVGFETGTLYPYSAVSCIYCCCMLVASNLSMLFQIDMLQSHLKMCVNRRDHFHTGYTLGWCHQCGVLRSSNR